MMKKETSSFAPASLPVVFVGSIGPGKLAGATA
jgi:hypothetical protein